MKNTKLQNIKDLFNKVAAELGQYSENAYYTLDSIASELMNVDNEKLNELGEDLSDYLVDSFVDDDTLENAVIPNILDDFGAAGVACLLEDYRSSHELHYVDGYGNIDDGDLFKSLECIYDEYKHKFDELNK